MNFSQCKLKRMTSFQPMVSRLYRDKPFIGCRGSKGILGGAEQRPPLPKLAWSLCRREGDRLECDMRYTVSIQTRVCLFWSLLKQVNWRSNEVSVSQEAKIT